MSSSCPSWVTLLIMSYHVHHEWVAIWVTMFIIEWVAIWVTMFFMSESLISYHVHHEWVAIWVTMFIKSELPYELPCSSWVSSSKLPYSPWVSCHMSYHVHHEWVILIWVTMFIMRWVAIWVTMFIKSELPFMSEWVPHKLPCSSWVSCHMSYHIHHEWVYIWVIPCSSTSEFLISYQAHRDCRMLKSTCLSHL